MMDRLYCSLTVRSRKKKFLIIDLKLKNCCMARRPELIYHEMIFLGHLGFSTPLKKNFLLLGVPCAVTKTNGTECKDIELDRLVECFHYRNEELFAINCQNVRDKTFALL